MSKKLQLIPLAVLAMVGIFVAFAPTTPPPLPQAIRASLYYPTNELDFGLFMRFERTNGQSSLVGTTTINVTPIFGPRLRVAAMPGMMNTCLFATNVAGPWELIPCWFGENQYLEFPVTLNRVFVRGGL